MVFWDQGICGVATVSTQKRHKAGDFGRCAGAAVRAIEERHEKLGRKPEQHPRLDARINQGLMHGKMQKKKSPSSSTTTGFSSSVVTPHMKSNYKEVLTPIWSHINENTLCAHLAT